MEAQHFSHEHTLTFREGNQEMCNGCAEPIDGPAYICEQCGNCELCKQCGYCQDCEHCANCEDHIFSLHKSCFELPTELVHPLHSHPLSLLSKRPHDSKYFICEECRDICFGFAYHCNNCSFTLDVKCASLTHDECQLRLKGSDRRRTRIKHDFHNHVLRLVNFDCKVIKKINHCSWCQLTISGLGYSCLDCRFHLHESCLEFPNELSSPLHPHSLTLLPKPPYGSEYFACEECRDVFFGFVFYCHQCAVGLDVKCATLTDDECRPQLNSRVRRTRVKHYLHHHILTLINFNLDIIKGGCIWCQSSISGLAYGCLDCRAFSVHESCLEEIPEQLSSPLHKHLLLPEFKSGSICKFCRQGIRGVGFGCDPCSFSLHHSCFEPPTLKHRYHEHDLIHFTRNRDKVCDDCRHFCTTSYYGCLMCDVNFHVSCLYLPKTVKHERHSHDLKLLEHSFEKDGYDVNECRCDICELQRNRDHHLYYCKECEFFAHIECVLNQKEEEKEVEKKSIKEDEEEIDDNNDDKKEDEEESEVSNAEEKNDIEGLAEKVMIKEFSHEHRLTFSDNGDTLNKETCRACMEKISDPSCYICLSCRYGLHKSCAELQLPLKILHPLHSIHPLTLLAKPPYYKFAICNECKNLCNGLVYHCDNCFFTLDLKCSTSLANSDGHRPKKLDKMPPIKHHHHDKHWFWFFQNGMDLVFCIICLKPVLGPGYGCIQCSDFIHKSCAHRPQRLQHPSHPEHPLPMYSLETPPYFRVFNQCNVCRYTIGNEMAYGCYKCKFHIHLDCADSVVYSIKHKCHNHQLVYIPCGLRTDISWCNFCDHLCYGVAFYHCLECDFSVHLKCMLPSMVEHECHSHPLKLMDSLVEDGPKEDHLYNVCDICELLRNPSLEVYLCEECKFVAHIHCVISEDTVESSSEKDKKATAASNNEDERSDTSLLQS